MPINSIDVGQRLRRTDNRQVESLMATIATVGLINALTVHRLSDREQEGLLPSYGRIAGAQLEACRRLNMTEVEVHVVTMGDLERQIVECDENLCAPPVEPG